MSERLSSRRYDFVSFHNPNQRGRGLVHLFRPVDSVPAGKGIKQGIEGKNENSETGEYPVSALAAQ